MRKEIERRFGIEALDLYGLSEVIGPGVSQEFAESKGAPIVWEDHFYPEVIDPERIPELEPDVILISSASAQDEIYGDLRHLEAKGVELVGLYGAEVQALESFSARPPPASLPPGAA